MKKMHVKRGDEVQVIAGKDKGKKGIHKEMPIDASNVMRICSKCGKPARTGVQILADGSKVRYCKKCKETFND